MADQLITGTTLTESRKTGEWVWRGDTTTNDFTVSDFTTDDAVHELDLSSILPTNANAVLFRISVNATTAGKSIAFGRNGGSILGGTVIGSRTQVANLQIEEQIMIECDGKQKIQYLAANTTWNTINLTVMAWILN